MRSVLLILLSAVVYLAGCARHEETAEPVAVSGVVSVTAGFVENDGQWDGEIMFRTSAGAASVWFTAAGVYYAMTRSKPGPVKPKAAPLSKGGKPVAGDSTTIAVLRVLFDGGDEKVRVRGIDTLESTVAYYVGADTTRWSSGALTFSRVQYERLYPNIDLYYYHREGRLKSDIMVAPGGRPDQIRFRYEGADRLVIDSSGALVVYLADEVMLTDGPPSAYQEIKGERREVACTYRLLSPNIVGIDVSGDYDVSNTLVIDPLIVFPHRAYGDYLFKDKETFSIASGDGEYLYVASNVTDKFLIRFGNPPFHFVDQQVIVVREYRLDEQRQRLRTTTYLGGSDNISRADAITTDGKGNTYVTGTTRATDFGLMPPPQMPHLSTPCKPHVVFFQLKHQAWLAGNNRRTVDLVASATLGECGSGYGHDIVLDEDGKVYIAGHSYRDMLNELINKPGPPPPYLQDQVAFVLKLEVTAKRTVNVLEGIGFGGEGKDHAYGLDVNSKGEVFVCGITHSENFQNNAHRWPGGKINGFLVKVKSDFSAVDWWTYLGGSNNDDAQDVALDGHGRAVVVGATSSTDFRGVDACRDMVNGCRGGYVAFVKIVNGEFYSDMGKCFWGTDGNYKEKYNFMKVGIDTKERIHIAGQRMWLEERTSKERTDAFLLTLPKEGAAFFYPTASWCTRADNYGTDIAFGNEGKRVYLAGAYETDARITYEDGKVDSLWGGFINWQSTSWFIY